MIVIKTQIIWFRAPTYFENDQDKTVLTSIQSVWVTRPTRSHFGATWARLGPFGGAWRKFCGFEATIRQYEHELICFRTLGCRDINQTRWLIFVYYTPCRSEVEWSRRFQTPLKPAIPKSVHRHIHKQPGFLKEMFHFRRFRSNCLWYVKSVSVFILYLVEFS